MIPPPAWVLDAILADRPRGVEVFTIALALPPNLANGRQHWRTKHAARLAYFESCQLRYAARLLPTLPPHPMPHATVYADVQVYRLMDEDNLMARCKWPLDWLRYVGYLAGDDRTHLRWGALPRQTAVKRDATGLTLVVVPSASTV